MNDIAFVGFSILIMCIFGSYSIHRGWKMLRNPANAKPSPIESIAIALVSITKGETAAKRKKSELMEPDRVKRSSTYYILVGCGLIFGGLLQLASWIISITSH